MARTNLPVGDPQAEKRWSGSLFIYILNKSYFDCKFVGESDNSVIQRLAAQGSHLITSGIQRPSML